MRTSVLLCVGSLLAGCGGGGDTPSETSEALSLIKDTASTVAKVATSGDDEETTIKMGDIEASMGEKVPEGFPLPVYEGTVITLGQRIDLGEKELFNLYFDVPGGGAVEVADFYEKALQGKGLEVNRTTIENIKFAGQKIVKLKVDDGTFLVVATIGSEEEGGSAGTLRWQGPAGPEG